MSRARPWIVPLALSLAACSGGAERLGVDAGAGGDAPLGPDEVRCEGRTLLRTPDDPAARGPWPVGARTLTIAGYTTEVWYPAEVGSDAGKEKARYDLRLQLPDADQGKIPDADNPWQDCDCVRDLPRDAAHGPYPLVLFVHGTAGFRTQSLSFMTHWASRGFVVVAADHPGMMLKDILGGQLGFHQADQAREILDALLVSPSGDALDLVPSIAPDHLAMSGHSAGGGAIGGFGDLARVLIPMAAGGTSPGPALASTLILGGMDDGVAKYQNQQTGYESSAPSKRLVGLTGAGHLAFSDICAIGRDQGGLLQVAIDHGIAVPALVATLGKDGCDPAALPPDEAWPIVDAASAAVLEETLACSATAAAALSGLQAAYPAVGEYREEL